MQRFRSFSVLFDCQDELEWVDIIEVQARESSFWDMVFIHIVNMAAISMIDINPQLESVRK
jgi:hypothetical protein